MKLLIIAPVAGALALASAPAEVRAATKLPLLQMDTAGPVELVKVAVAAAAPAASAAADQVQEVAGSVAVVRLLAVAVSVVVVPGSVAVRAAAARVSRWRPSFRWRAARWSGAESGPRPPL